MDLSLLHTNINKKSKIPLYVQVEKIIENLLLIEPYSSGSKLPNEIEISEKLNLSRNTIRKAMYALINKNLIIRKKNRGTFKNMSKEQVKTTLTDWYSFNDSMKKQNKDFKIFHYETSKEIVSYNICDKLDIKRDKKVIKLLRVKGNFEPELYVESYFHPDLNLSIKELNSTEILKLYYFLEDKLNIKISYTQDEISATNPNKDMIKYLKLKNSNIPIIMRKMLIFDEQKRIIAYSIGYYLSNKFVFNLNISR